MRRLWLLFVTGAVGAGILASCYYTPNKRRAKADDSYLSEVEAEKLIQKKLAPYGIKFVSNMKLKRGDILFVADGYDRDLRVGYEYRSHEGMDFEKGEENGDGLSDEEIGLLQERQKEYREYILVVPEGDQESVDQAVDQFVKDLYTWEVLKKAKPKSSKDNLFPEEAAKNKDLLPWESTKDVKKKRKEMEAREELKGKPGAEEDSGDDWGTDESEDDDEWGTIKDGKDKGKDESKDEKDDIDEEDF